MPHCVRMSHALVYYCMHEIVLYVYVCVCVCMGVSWYIACVVYVYMCLNSVHTIPNATNFMGCAYVCMYVPYVPCVRSSAPFQACRFRYDSFCVQGVNTWMSHVTEQFAIDTFEDHCQRRVI